MPDNNNKNLFEYHNSVNICGKVVFKRPAKNSNLFAISVSRRTRRTDEKGKPVMAYRMVDVYFEGAAGKQYNTQYEIGDFVAISGILQKTRNFHLARDMVKVLGLNMVPKITGSHEIPDSNQVKLRGKIARATAVNDDLIICSIYTNVHKEFPNPVPGAEITTFNDDYVSETPIAIWRTQEGQHDARTVVNNFTKGTWVDITGFIDTRKMELRNGRIITEQRVIAASVNIVGDVQLPQKEQTTRPSEKIIIPINKPEENVN